LSAAVETRRAEVVVSVLEELAARDGLDQALGGRDAVSLTALLRFVARHIAEPRYCKLMCSLTHRLLDLYASVVGISAQVRVPIHRWVGQDAFLFRITCCFDNPPHFDSPG